MNFCCVFEFYALFFGDVEQVFSCLAQEVFVCYFFGVVVPVPHFDSVACGVGDYGFAFEGWVVA